MYDIIVVGGGPGGAAAAMLLARAGVRVLVLERARFPRDKPCGEFLTPGAAGVLREISAWPAAEAAGASPIGRMAFIAPSGARFEHAPPDGEPAGWAIRRTALDVALLGEARRAGAEVREGTTARGMLLEDGQVRGVYAAPVGTQEDGAASEIPARLVLGADGAHSRVARELGLVRPIPRLERVAVVTHWRGVPKTDALEMRSRKGVVCGYGPLGGGEANVTLVASRREAARMAGRAGAYVEETLVERFPDLAARLAGAEREPEARTVGCFGHLCRRTSAPGALLVGDAAAFIDPFTGEGVYFALRGAQIAAGIAVEALGEDALSGARLLAYDRARRELSRRYLLCAAVQAVVRTPWLLERAVRRLARDPATAARFLGVIGDVRPPGEALNAGMAWRLLASG